MYTLKGIAALTLTGLILATTGCGPFIGGSGDVILEDRNVAGFTGVTLNGIGKVQVEQDSVFSVVVETDDNLMDYIVTSRSGSTLRLDVRNGVNILPTRLKYHIAMPDIRRLKIDGSGDIALRGAVSIGTLSLVIDGSGDIDVDSVSGNTLATKIDGSGDVTLDGDVVMQRIIIDGSGDVKASGLDTDTTDILVDGSGNCHVAVRERLVVEIDGSGDVYYTGSPSVKTTIDGSGDVVQR